MTLILNQATRGQAHELMRQSMPPFERFLEHCTALKSECEKAGELTAERAALFDAYRDQLIARRSVYEERVADNICQHFTGDEVDLLTSFYGSAMHRAVEKALGLSTVINNLGTLWQTEVLESCPDTWKMIMDNVGEWQRKNTPEDCDVVTPEAPPDRGAWRRVNLHVVGAAKPDEEYVPAAPQEEAELARLQQEPESA